MASSVSLTLPQMVDLALGSPEVGSVNFNILHSLLHVMICQLELQQCAVEFGGADSERIQAAMASSRAPGAELSEYRVRDRSRRDKELAKQRLLPVPGAQPQPRGHRGERADLASSVSGGSTSSSDCRGAAVRRGKKEKGRKGCRRCIGLEDAEEVLRHSRRRRFSAHILEALSGSQRRGRLPEDAADASKSQTDLSGHGEAGAGRDGGEVCVLVPPRVLGPSTARTRTLTARVGGADMDGLAGRTAAVEHRVAELTTQGEDALRRLRVLEDAAARNPNAKGPAALACAGECEGVASARRLEAELAAELAAQGRAAVALQAEVRQLSARADGLGRGMTEMDRRMQAVQADVDTFVAHLGTLFREKEQRACAIKGLQTQLQTLERQKADRWQLEAALAEKADRGLVSAKVSHSEFSAACANLHSDLGQAKSKLTETESRLDSKLDRAELPAVAAELAEHVERMVEKQAADQSKHSLQQAQAEHFAAATTVRLLRNVSCISCDGPRAMRCDDWCPAVPVCDSFPDRRPTRPHIPLTGDGQSTPHPVGLGGAGAPPPVSARNAAPGASGEGWDNCHVPTRLVTRFCGGSHTLTAVGARVTSAGHHRTAQAPAHVPLGCAHLNASPATALPLATSALPHPSAAACH